MQLLCKVFRIKTEKFLVTLLFESYHDESLLFVFSHCCVQPLLCPALCDPMDCSTPGFRVLHYLLEFTQTRVHGVHDAIQPPHPLLSPSPPSLNLSQHQGLFQWVGSLHQEAKALEQQSVSHLLSSYVLSDQLLAPKSLLYPSNIFLLFFSLVTV